MSVLDGYCNSGSFGIHSLIAGAARVTFVDSSEREINNVKENLRLNNITAESELIVSDMFIYLEQCISSGKKFDLILLDPPSFAPSKRNVPSALKGYTKLAYLALRCISRNGYLVLSSCSHHISEEDFLQSIKKACVKCNVNIRLVHFSGASADHPVLLSMPETKYLKFAVFSV
jgi:23S rRNA (cytosine1962-C5)-methyltransferase